MSRPDPPRGLDALTFAPDFAQRAAQIGTPTHPVPLTAPYLIGLAPGTAHELGLDATDLQSPDALAVLAGNRPPHGSEPIATVYSGHQFGVWAGQLGDGRALAIGEVLARDGTPQVLQWKGSGPTAYSRGGDGRAVLRSAIREFIASEALAALGVASTRALSLVGSDMSVMRETRETAAVVIRVAPNFVRFGHFEHHAAAGNHAALRALADEIIDRHHPDLAPPASTHPRPAAVYAAWLTHVASQTGRLIAHWQSLGFCHGVLNTDNMSILGLTLDYGPFGFMDRFNAHHICNHSDTAGRYAWSQQPAIGAWNCSALAHALSPLLPDPGLADQALGAYETAYHEHLLALLRNKLGLLATHPNDPDLLADLFSAMQDSAADFTLFFRRLADIDGTAGHDAALWATMRSPHAIKAWLERYQQRLRAEDSDDLARRRRMNRCNPLYVPRNHLLEEAIQQAQPREGRERDFSELNRLLDVFGQPYEARAGLERYADLPPEWAHHLKLSCSS